MHQYLFPFISLFHRQIFSLRYFLLSAFGYGFKLADVKYEFYKQILDRFYGNFGYYHIVYVNCIILENI